MTSISFLGRDAEFLGNDRGRVKVDFLVDRRHDAELDQFLDHFSGRFLDGFGKFLDRQDFRQLDMRQDGPDDRGRRLDSGGRRGRAVLGGLGRLLVKGIQDGLVDKRRGDTLAG